MISHTTYKFNFEFCIYDCFRLSGFLTFRNWSFMKNSCWSQSIAYLNGYQATSANTVAIFNHRHVKYSCNNCRDLCLTSIDDNTLRLSLTCYRSNGFKYWMVKQDISFILPFITTNIKRK